MVADKKNETTLARTFGNKSLVVQCLPENRDQVRKLIEALPDSTDPYDALTAAQLMPVLQLSLDPAGA